MKGRGDIRRGRGEMRRTSDPATTYGRTAAKPIFFCFGMSSGNIFKKK
jgi:hypothetical protein